MPTLRAYEKELRKGFLDNEAAAGVLENGNHRRPGLLVLFYAVECGLKFMMLARYRGGGAPDPNIMFSHDLREIVKELRLAEQLPGWFRLQRDDSSCPGKECHLAWRYGVGIRPEDEQLFKTALLVLVARIRQDI